MIKRHIFLLILILSSCIKDSKDEILYQYKTEKLTFKKIKENIREIDSNLYLKGFKDSEKNFITLNNKRTYFNKKGYDEYKKYFPTDSNVNLNINLKNKEINELLVLINDLNFEEIKIENKSIVMFNDYYSGFLICTSLDKNLFYNFGDGGTWKLQSLIDNYKDNLIPSAYKVDEEVYYFNTIQRIP